MATMVPGHSQTVTFPQSSVHLPGPQESAFASSHLVAGSGSELETRTHQLSLLVEVNAALAGALDVESVLGGILSRLADRERLSHARIYRLDAPTGELQRVAFGGRNGASRRVVSLKEPTLLAWAIRQKSAVYVPQVDRDPRCQEFSNEEQCAYAVPLQTSTSVLGVLDVAADHADGIRSVTRKLIDQVATQAALALERSELYKQLRVSEERFRSIFEQVHFGVALTSLDGRFSTTNPAFARLLGYTCEELQGKHFAEITHPHDAAASQECLQTLLKDGAGQVNLELRYLRKSGGTHWCATSISLLHDAAGRPAYFLGMVQDIDERKNAEEERTRLQQQLFQAQKMEALGTLAGGIAHDFNNLLSVMLGFASLARQRLSSDDPLQDSMGMIEQSAQRAAELTRQLLGFARPERQQVKPVCIDEVLDRVRRMVERTFDRNITVAVHKGSDPHWVNAEPSFLEQALLNLCINARDAMPQGGTLTVKSETVTLDAQQAGIPPNCLPGSYASISVEDTGTGIAPEALPRVFEPFFTTKEQGRGTGLGLAMVYGFVKNHDGFVKVESEPGHGARFTISLPLIPAPSPQREVRGLGKLQPGQGTVLVVDDEPLVRAFATEGLKGLGYQVLVAENGKEALEIYEQHREKINCVLLDLIMPEISGLETYRRMREADPSVRVVFASGYSTGEILRDAPDARSAAFIGKPYTLEGLSIALCKAGAGMPR
ncbi:MAG: PAS domain S-box protein [Acidobacteriota bacterium]|nr:PAS domain S-box protein [Acidobacteriota bacterium]